jgi:DNA polymerase-3 subunit beta
MSFFIEKKVFFEMLQKVFPVVPLKSSLQILSNIKISLFQNKMEMSATDLDQSIKVSGPVTGSGEYEITVNARKIFDIVRELHDGEIKIYIDDHVLILESGGSFSCKIAGADARDFPTFPIIENSTTFELGFNELKEMIVKSSFAVSRDEMKACLCGVLWEIEAERMGMIATDGHRLGSVFHQIQSNVSTKISCIIPPKSLLNTLRVFNNENTSYKVKIAVGEKYITFSDDHSVVCSKLIEGPYPDYEKVIPRSNPKCAIAQRNDLQNAVRRVSVLSNQKTHLVKFSFAQNELEIMVLNREIGGEARQKVPVEYNGDQQNIGFNASYLSEIISMIATENVRIEMNTQISACIILPVYEKDTDKKSDNLFLIMPLRIMEDKEIEE